MQTTYFFPFYFDHPMINVGAFISFFLFLFLSHSLGSPRLSSSFSHTIGLFSDECSLPPSLSLFIFLLLLFPVVLLLSSSTERLKFFSSLSYVGQSLISVVAVDVVPSCLSLFPALSLIH